MRSRESSLSTPGDPKLHADGGRSHPSDGLSTGDLSRRAADGLKLWPGNSCGGGGSFVRAACWLYLLLFFFWGGDSEMIEFEKWKEMEQHFLKGGFLRRT